MRKGYEQVDHLLLITVFALLVVGIIMITSIGVPKSIQLSAPDVLYPNCSDSAVDCYLVLKKHLIRVAIGVIAFLAALKINYRFWDKVATAIFLGSIGLLIAVFIFGSANNTIAQSWINVGIPFLNSIQPSEVAKFGLVVYLAVWITRRMEKRDGLDDWKQGFFSFAIISGLILLPVMAQPDLGSSLVLATIAGGMYFVGGAPIKQILAGIGIAAFFSLIAMISVDYINERFMGFIAPGDHCEESYCWQAEQSRIAIGSGGLWGKGLTQGIQKSYWLPQASDDFIFAASAEELGFFRIIFVLIGYAIIGYRGFQISAHAPTKFASLLAAGMTIWITAQAFLNIMVNTSLFPITGITLPFISYGGSSMLTSMLAIGVLLNISKYTTNHAYTTNGRRHSGAHHPQYRRFGRA